MAKGQVSEEELSLGLKGLGGFGSLGGARVVKDSPFRDSRSAPKVIDVAKPEVVKAAPALPAVPPIPKAEPVVEVVRPAPAKKTQAKAKMEAATRRVADIYTERVTLQLSPEMRDKVDALARELQRSKSSKDERITSNTVMRVAIRHLLKHYKVTGSDVPNGEEEFLEAIEKRCSWK